MSLASGGCDTTVLEVVVVTGKKEIVVISVDCQVEIGPSQYQPTNQPTPPPPPPAFELITKQLGAVVRVNKKEKLPSLGYVLSSFPMK